MEPHVNFASPTRFHRITSRNGVNENLLKTPDIAVIFARFFEFVRPPDTLSRSGKYRYD